MENLVLSVSIAHVWASIRETREKIGQLLVDSPLELRVATMIAGSELLENAVKYGESVAGAPGISFSLTVREDGVELRAANGSKDLEAVDRLKAIVQRISESEDAQALYFRAIEEAALRPLPTYGSGLGLYRIAAEGYFSLSCNYHDDVVEVLANRSL